MKREHPSSHPPGPPSPPQPFLETLQTTISVSKASLASLEKVQTFLRARPRGSSLDEPGPARCADIVATTWLLTAQHYSALFEAMAASLGPDSVHTSDVLRRFHADAASAATHAHASRAALAAGPSSSPHKKRRTSAPVLAPPHPEPQPAVLLPGVRYTDVSAEVDALLAAKRARRGVVSLAERKRKRVSRDSGASSDGSGEEGPPAPEGGGDAVAEQQRGKRAKTGHERRRSGVGTGVEEMEVTQGGGMGNGHDAGGKLEEQAGAKRRARSTATAKDGRQAGGKRRHDPEPDEAPTTTQAGGRGGKKRRFGR